MKDSAARCSNPSVVSSIASSKEDAISLTADCCFCNPTATEEPARLEKDEEDEDDEDKNEDDEDEDDDDDDDDEDDIADKG